MLRRNLHSYITSPLAMTITMITGGCMMFVFSLFSNYPYLRGNLGEFGFIIEIFFQILISLLVGMFVGGNMHRYMLLRSSLSRKTSILGGFGTLLSVLVIGCPGCGLTLAGVLGLTGFLSALPSGGMELKYFGVLFLLMANILLFRGLGNCMLPRKHDISHSKQRKKHTGLHLIGFVSIIRNRILSIKNFMNEKNSDQANLILAVVGAALVIILVQVFVLPGTLAKKVNKELVNREVTQVGGQANYDKIYNYQMNQAKLIADKLDASGNFVTEEQAEVPTPDTEEFEPSFIEAEAVSAILEDAYVKGNASAQIVWLEYSDLECPYCKKLHDAGTIDQVLEAYDNNIAYSFRHYPLAFHANAARGAEASECAAKLGKDADYFRFIESVFAQGTPVDAVLKEAATSIGLNADALMACVDKGEFADMVLAQMDEGKNNFGVTGTPGNVLINTKTGEFRVIAGAYPTQSFLDAIAQLLGE